MCENDKENRANTGKWLRYKVGGRYKKGKHTRIAGKTNKQNLSKPVSIVLRIQKGENGIERNGLF